MRILMVEDEYNLADVVSSSLRDLNYEVDVKSDGEEGLESALTGIYDLIILDVMLPHVDGFTILEEIRKNHIDSKVIMLTAKSTLDDKLEGLENGANDYITKPFHMKELMARINIQLNPNVVVKKDNELVYKDLILDLSNMKLKAKKSKQSVDLVNKEFQLLEYFMKNPNQVLSKDQIYEKVWGFDSEAESNNLEVFISFLRKKIVAIGSNVNIKAIRGVGYKLEVKDE